MCVWLHQGFRSKWNIWGLIFTVLFEGQKGSLLKLPEKMAVSDILYILFSPHQWTMQSQAPKSPCPPRVSVAPARFWSLTNLEEHSLRGISNVAIVWENFFPSEIQHGFLSFPSFSFFLFFFLPLPYLEQSTQEFAW